MEVQVSPDDLLGLLGLAMVEIRSSESLHQAQVWADVFHNVPSSVRNGSSPRETIDRLLACAERHDKREYFERYISNYLGEAVE